MSLLGRCPPRFVGRLLRRGRRRFWFGVCVSWLGHAKTEGGGEGRREEGCTFLPFHAPDPDARGRRGRCNRLRSPGRITVLLYVVS